jgi:hypothetical protein
MIEIFGDGIRDEIGIWLEIVGESSVPHEARRLTFVSVSLVLHEEKTFLEIRCLSPTINRQFYLFATAVADRVSEYKETPQEAVDLELRNFGALLQEKYSLSIERQIGLLGELLVLERLVVSEGPFAVDAWIGPQGEPHDFKIGNREFEVKTTSGTRRIHVINGLKQLTPSPECSLFILSVLLGPGGKDSGSSLPMKIEEIEQLLKRDSGCLKAFHDSLESVGYVTADRSQYDRSFALRRPLALIPVDAKFPVITMSSLFTSIGEAAHRLDHIEYHVNVEGLESEEGTELYSTIFPWYEA